MGLGVVLTMPPDLVDDAGEGLIGRKVAVQHGEGIAIVTSDADLDAGLGLDALGAVVDHHSSDLESEDLAADLAVLRHHLGTRLGQQGHQPPGDRGRFQRRGAGSRTSSTHRATVHHPHLRRRSERRGAPGQDACCGGFVDQDVQLFDAVASGPDQGAAEGDLGRLGHEDPTDPTATHGDPAGERVLFETISPRDASARLTSMQLVDESGQLDGEEP